MIQTFSKIELSDSTGKPLENIVRFAHKAMATIYEIYIESENYTYAEQAATEAFILLDQLEQDLSKYISNSDISRIRVAPVYEPVGLGMPAFECLKKCIELHEKTGGVFDVTIGHLMECWLDDKKELRHPSQQEIEIAAKKTGLQHLVLDEENFTAIVFRAPLAIDLGGFGKGYAVDKMAELLKDWDISRALIHGGTSSVFALDPPSGLAGWPLSISIPQTGKLLCRIYLENRALSGSGLQKGQHIIDPRTGKPTEANFAAWVLAEDAATADALSTAFMIMNPEEIKQFISRNPEVNSIVIPDETDLNENSDEIMWLGNWPENEK